MTRDMGFLSGVQKSSWRWLPLYLLLGTGLLHFLTGQLRPKGASALKNLERHSSMLKMSNSLAVFSWKIAKLVEDEEIFTDECGYREHTFEIFENGKVLWVSENHVDFWMNRGKSIHCLLARLAPRINAGNFRLRIALDDVDTENPFVLTMAWKEDMTVTSKSLLFPEFSMASWPEVGDFSIPATVQRVLEAAEENGLPVEGGDISAWKQRDPRIAWRGAAVDPIRQEMVSLSKEHPRIMDVQSIEYKTESDDPKMQNIASSNKLSRWDHCKYRFLLHLNGIGNWRYSAGSKWKLLCGSLLFVKSDPLFLEWWEAGGALRAYEHYVPFTDGAHLLREVKYYSKNLTEAARIARNGMELAKYAFESRDDFMVEALTMYANATRHMKQSRCPENKETKLKTALDAKYLDELKELYGPRVCP